MGSLRLIIVSWPCVSDSPVIISQTKSLTNCFTSDHKIVIHSDPYIILFIIHFFMLWTHKPDENNHFAHFTIVTKDILFNLALWCHTSARHWYYAVIFIDCYCICKFDIHSWITTVNIAFPSPGIHSIACKETNLQEVFETNMVI